MPWRQADFKGQKVWALVDAGGNPEVKGGRVPIRYQKRDGAKIYQAGASRVEIDASAPVEALDEGTPAAPPTSGSATGATGASGGKSSRGSGFGKAGTRTEAQAAMAADAARALIQSLEGRAVLCFTDGACKGNPGPAGSGAVVEAPGHPRREKSVGLGRATNNVAELTAVGLAVDIVEDLGLPEDAEIAVFTDSKYTHGVLVKGWKAKANRELILELRARLQAWPGLKIHWIAGHVGVEGNERADALANAGVEASRA